MAGAPMNEYGLTDRQEAFVGEYVRNGGNGTAAAKAAGYSTSAAHQRAHELVRMPKVQARMDTLAREHLANCAPIAIETLKQLAVSASSETVRAAAASSLLDRSGYKTPVKIEIDDHRTQADVDKELAILLGLEQPADPAAAGPEKPVH